MPSIVQQHAHEFNTNVALHELYAYAVKYNDQVRFILPWLEVHSSNPVAFVPISQT